MKTKNKKLTTLNDVLAEMSPEERERVRSIRKYYDTLYALRERRKELGLTQEELAEQTGLPRPTISKIESGNRNIRVENLIKLTRALKLDIQLVSI